MQNTSLIQFLNNREINKQLWDECITFSSNGLIYAKSFYLDSMCENWSAIIGENYNWVMPITNRTKWGISYLYQPSFTQQLGVFTKPGINVPYMDLILFLQNRYLFWEVSFNYSTPAQMLNTSLKITHATNFILNLNDSYKSLASNYYKDLIKNLKKSQSFSHIYRETRDYKKCIQLYKQHYAARLPMIKEADYEKFEQICNYLHTQNGLICREVTNKENKVLASALILLDGKRLYNIMNTTTGAGRRKAANHFLVDSIIKEFAGSHLLFDFEGSDVPGVKSFYKNFGAESQPFFRVKYNNLPWPLKFFKK